MEGTPMALESFELVLFLRDAWLRRDRGDSRDVSARNEAWICSVVRFANAGLYMGFATAKADQIKKSAHYLPMFHVFNLAS
jgi:hypothetical protein